MATKKATTTSDLTGQAPTDRAGLGYVNVHRDEPSISPELEKVRDEQIKREGDPALTITRDEPTISPELEAQRDAEIERLSSK